MFILVSDVISHQKVKFYFLFKSKAGREIREELLDDKYEFVGGSPQCFEFILALQIYRGYL